MSDAIKWWAWDGINPPQDGDMPTPDYTPQQAANAAAEELDIVLSEHRGLSIAQRRKLTDALAVCREVANG